MEIDARALRDNLHGLTGEWKVIAGDGQGEILVPLRQEFGAREEIQIAMAGHDDFVIVERLRPRLAEESRFNPQ